MTTRLALLNAVVSYSRRTDAAFAAQLGTMLQQFEARLAREVVHSSMVTVTTLALSGRTVTLPTDCLEVRSVTVQSSGAPLDWVTPEVLREGALWNGSGDPRQYTIENRDIYVAPAGTATLDLSYYARFAALVTDTDTTTLLTNEFDLYLAGMMVEAARFVGDPAMEREWEGRYVDKRILLLTQDSDYQVSGSASRRIGVQDIV